MLSMHSPTLLSLAPEEIPLMPAEDGYSFEFSSERPLAYTGETDIVTPIEGPHPEFEASYNSQNTETGNAIFDVTWSGGELFVGKTFYITATITDPNGFDPANVTIDWFRTTESGGFFPNSPFLSGAFDEYNTYTITPEDLPSASSTGQLIYRISVEDHAGNIEYFQNITSPTQEVPSEAPNSARSDYTYNDLIENMESVGR